MSDWTATTVVVYAYILVLCLSHGMKLPVPDVIHGDLCSRLDGRKYFLSEGTTAFIYAKNVTYPPLSLRTIRGHNIPGFHRVNRRLRAIDENVIRLASIATPTYIFEPQDSKHIKKSITKFNKPVTSDFRPSENLPTLPFQQDDQTQSQHQFEVFRSGDVKASEKEIDTSADTAKSKPLNDSPYLEGSKDTFQPIHSDTNSIIESNNILPNSKQKKKSHKADSTNGLPFSPGNPKNGKEPFSLGKIKIGDKLPLSSSQSSQDTQSSEHPQSSSTSFSLLPSSTFLPSQKSDYPTRGLSDPFGNTKDIDKGSKRILKDTKFFQPDENLEETKQASKLATNGQLSCGLEFFTCPNCHLKITFTSIKLTSCSHDQSCRCDYVRLREPPYLTMGGRDACSISDKDVPFVTKTKEATIDFFYSRDYEEAFSLAITAERNNYDILGDPEVTFGTISSPFFPELYPTDFQMEYTFQASDQRGKVKITFLDFQVSPWSFVEKQGRRNARTQTQRHKTQVQDTNKSRIVIFNGNHFRPPVLISSGPTMMVRFTANGETGRGFRMQYHFVKEDAPEVIQPPLNDCGGHVTNFGGFITMMNMTSSNDSSVLYDCVWIIKPPQDYAFKSHLAIKVVQFEEMGVGSALEIRQGMTSQDYILEMLTEEGSFQAASQEHVVAVDTGFYVRLKASFKKNSKLAIVYTSFSYLGNCYPITDLLCHNHRCIPKMLRCDGFDHCGDESDEPPSCYKGRGGKESLTPEDAIWWYENTPNYYFPQKNSIFGTPNGSGMLLLFSLFALLLVILGLLWFMFRQNIDNARMNRNRERRNNTNFNDGVEIFDASADDPPVYEPPPDYDDVLKIILSGTNLKLVRRPGGRTAWVPDLPKESPDLSGPRRLSIPGGEEAGGNQLDLFAVDSAANRPKRTRHPSLDFEKENEIILWQPNSTCPSRRTSMVAPKMEEDDEEITPIINVPGHVRCPSLPEIPISIVDYVQKHVVSMAPETVPEIRKIEETLVTSSLPESSTSREPTLVPGPSATPKRKVSKESTTNESGRSSVIRRSIKKGKRKTSTGKKKMSRKISKESLESTLPPSYEMVILQKNSDKDKTIHVSFSKGDRHNIGVRSSAFKRGTHKRSSAALRVRAARERFQKLSRGESVIMDEIFETKDGKQSPTNKNVSETKEIPDESESIGIGTVEEKRAELLKLQLRDCNCTGACACADNKEKVEPENNQDDYVSPGLVKSKIQFYKTISIPRNDSLKDCCKDIDHMESPSIPSLIEEEIFKANYLETIKESCEKNKDEPTSDNPKTKSLIASDKRMKMFRKYSEPSLDVKRNRDLDIFFSQEEPSNYFEENYIQNEPLASSEVEPLIGIENDFNSLQNNPEVNSNVIINDTLVPSSQKESEHNSHSATSNGTIKLTLTSFPVVNDVPVSLSSPKSLDNSSSSSESCGPVEETQDEMLSEVLITGDIGTVKFKDTSMYEDTGLIVRNNLQDWNEQHDTNSGCVPYLSLNNEASTPEINTVNECEPFEDKFRVATQIQHQQPLDEDDHLPHPSSGAVPKRYNLLPCRQKSKTEKKKKRKSSKLHDSKHLPAESISTEEEQLLDTIYPKHDKSLTSPFNEDFTSQEDNMNGYLIDCESGACSLNTEIDSLASTRIQDSESGIQPVHVIPHNFINPHCNGGSFSNEY